MSPRKLTEDDKQEILEQYRNSEATTSTLAKSYEVSSSTISRFLKNKLSTTEYEDLIQQKRLARTPRGEKSAESDRPEKTKAEKTKTKKTKTKAKEKAETKTKTKAKTESKSKTKKSAAKTKQVNEVVPNESAMPELATAENLQQDTVPSQEEPKPRRRRRTRAMKAEAAVPELEVSQPVATLDLESEPESEPEPELEPELEPEVEPTPNKLVLNDVPSKSERLILKKDRPEVDEGDDEDDEDEEDEDNEADITALKEMLGEDLEDINDDEDDEDDDDWDEEDADFSERSADPIDVQILPLSQASLPKTCYLVIDRSAELIVKPMAEFADLGNIPDTETRQRTLPVFDNHRIAKRFSHRRERVIKVPDGRMLQKTSHHLQDKGITRLLIDGQIYSLF